MILLAAVAIWMAIIFSLSGQVAGKSASLSGSTAHVLAYLLLGILCMAALYQYSMKKGMRFAAAFTVCTGYAGTDEFHQLYRRSNLCEPRSKIEHYSNGQNA